MNILVVILSVVSGYLIGAVSFARIIARWRGPQVDITRTDVPIPKTQQKMRMNGVSGTSVIVQINKRWGYFTGFLDWLKIFAPALVLRLYFPSEPYFLIFATLGVIGHNWPVYYGFKGGYGISATCGGVMVADWPYLLPGILIMFSTIAILNAITHRFHLSVIIGFLALLPWFWFRTHDWWYVIFCLVVSTALFIRVYPDMKAFSKARPES